MTAKGQLTLLGAPSTGLNLRDKWLSGLSTDKWASLVKSSQEREGARDLGGRWKPAGQVPTRSWEHSSAQERVNGDL